MGNSVNIQQVNTIIQDLHNTVKEDHVGSLNDGTVTQTTQGFFQRVAHWFKTTYAQVFSKASEIIHQHRAILSSYRTMIENNIGNNYGRLFSERMRKIENDGSYTDGKELSRQLKSIVAQYEADIQDPEKISVAQTKGIAQMNTKEWQALFQTRFETELRIRHIPSDYSRIQEMHETAKASFFDKLWRSDLRNGWTGVAEQGKMLDIALLSAFKDVNKINCDDLCANYPFIAEGSDKSMDVMLKAALTKKGIDIDVPQHFITTLINDVKDTLQRSTTFVKRQDVQDSIDLVIKNTVTHEFIDNQLNTILVKNIINANISSKASGIIVNTAKPLSEAIQAIAKSIISTKDLETTLHTICKDFRQACNDVPSSSKMSQKEQDAIFSLALESAIDFCLLDVPGMEDTRSQLLNHSNSVFGGGEAFVNTLYALSTGTLANTDPNYALMLKLSRNMIEVLNDRIDKAPQEIQKSINELYTQLQTKHDAFAVVIEKSQSLMEQVPTLAELQNKTVQLKYKTEIEKYEGIVRRIVSEIKYDGRPADHFDKYVVGLQSCIAGLKRLGNFQAVKSELKVGVLQGRTDDWLKSFTIFENEINALKNKGFDNADEVDSAEATLHMVHNELLKHMDELKEAKERFETEGIAAFTKHMNILKADGRTLHAQMANLREDIDNATHGRDVVLSQIDTLNATTAYRNAQHDQVNALDANAANEEASNEYALKVHKDMLQQFDTSIASKTTELTQAVQTWRKHETNQMDVIAMHESMISMQKEIKFLQGKIDALPLTEEERKANSTVIKFLLENKDFGGLVHPSVYENIHKEMPALNDSALKEKDKSRLVPFMENTFRESGKAEHTPNGKMEGKLDKLKKTINAKIIDPLMPLATQKKMQQQINRLKDTVSELRQERREPLHSATQYYNQSFIQDFQDGLLVSVNGKVAPELSPKSSKDAQIQSFTALSAMFGDPKIAGQVLAPFTKKNMQDMRFAMVGNDTKFGNAVTIEEVVGDHIMSGRENCVLDTNEVHVHKRSNNEYGVIWNVSNQQKNGDYAHHTLRCTVKIEDNKTITYTVDDMDVTYHKA